MASDEHNNPDDDPYGSPKAVLSDVRAANVTGTIRVLPAVLRAEAGMRWWREGWALFRPDAGAWILATLLFAVISLILDVIPIVSNFSIIAETILAAGFCAGAQTAYRGGRFEINHLFAGFGPALGPLALVGVLSYAITALSEFAFGLFAGPSLSIDSLTSFPPSFEVVNSVGLHFLFELAVAAVIGTLLWFVPNLVVNWNVPVFEAVSMNLNGCTKNPMPLLIFAGAGLLFSFAMILTLGVGFVVLLPVTATATYCASREIFVE